MKQRRILGIDPGTKTIGIAVLEGLELLYYGVKTIKRPKTPQEILREVSDILLTIVAEYQPQILAIEKMFLVQKNASLLIVVAEEMKATARRQQLAVYEYAPTTVRKLICQTGRATKREAVEIIAGRFVELRQYLNRQSRWEELYWANMFDAVAVALCCYQDLLSQGSERSE